jgi:glucosamine--fructose-6-phosphate aminotransferase (isomerizing)
MSNEDTFTNTYMYEEIFQQPLVVEHSFEKASKIFPDFHDLLVENNHNLTIFGSGTSYHAGLSGSIVFSNMMGKYIPVDHASEWIYRYPKIADKSGVAIAISQSGESGDVIRSANLAKDRGLKLISITNVSDSTLDELGDLTVITPAGEEKAIAATKSYVTALALLLEWAVELGKEHNSELKALYQELVTIPDKMRKILSSINEELKSFTQNIYNKDTAFFLGMGSNYSTALEGAMKLKETGNVFAEGFGFREFMHGHIQLVSEETPIILILSGEEDPINIKQGVDRLVNLGASVFIVSQVKNHNAPSSFKTHHMFLNEYVNSLLSPLTLVLPLQLLACRNAKMRGLNPDKPSKLSKITL